MFEWSYGLGWLYGWFFIFIRRTFMYKYLNYVSDKKAFNLGLYVLYTVLSFAIVIGTIYLAIQMKEWIYPVSVLVAYIIDYILWMIKSMSQSRKE